jgi:hypothetical protein
VILSIAAFELYDNLCSIELVQHEPADGTSQYLNFTSVNENKEETE